MDGTETLSLVQRFKAYVTKTLLSPRMVKFGIVGASGTVVNMGLLYVLTDLGRMPYFISSVIAIEVSILSNFTINHLWTWSDRSGHGTLSGKLIRYHIGAGATGLGNYLILILLTEMAGLHYLVSNLIGIGIGTMANFLINDLWTFRHRKT